MPRSENLTFTSGKDKIRESQRLQAKEQLKNKKIFGYYLSNFYYGV